MLGFAVSATAANMMLVRCNSDVPISEACLAKARDSPGVIGTTSLRDLESLQSGRQRVEDHAIRPGLAPHLTGRSCHPPRSDEG